MERLLVRLLTGTSEDFSQQKQILGDLGIRQVCKFQCEVEKLTKKQGTMTQQRNKQPEMDNKVTWGAWQRI